MPDFRNIILEKFRMPIACHFIHAAFVLTVLHVFSVRTKREMARAKARGIIAFMQNFKPTSNRPVRQSISEYVRTNVAIGPAFKSSYGNPVRYREGAISSSMAIRPNHAGIILWNMLEKFEQLKESEGMTPIVEAFRFSDYGIIGLHRSALRWRAVLALAVFAHRGAFSILPCHLV